MHPAHSHFAPPPDHAVHAHHARAERLLAVTERDLVAQNHTYRAAGGNPRAVATRAGSTPYLFGLRCGGRA